MIKLDNQETFESSGADTTIDIHANITILDGEYAFSTAHDDARNLIAFDSGAGANIFNNADMMWNLQPKEITIIGIGPTAAKTTAIGMSIFGKALYVPEAAMSLVSQTTIHDQGIDFFLDQDRYTIPKQTRISEDIIFDRSRIPSMYTTSTSQIIDITNDSMQDIDEGQHQYNDFINAMAGRVIPKLPARLEAARIHVASGHSSHEYIIQLLDQNVIVNTKAPLHELKQALRYNDNTCKCFACIWGKSRNKNPNVHHNRATTPGKGLCADVVHSEHFDGSNSVQHLSIDEATGFMDIIDMARNNSDALSCVHKELKLLWAMRDVQEITLHYDHCTIIESMKQYVTVVGIQQAQPGQHQLVMEGNVRKFRDHIRAITTSLHFVPDMTQLNYLMKWIIHTLNMSYNRVIGDFPMRKIHPNWKLDATADLTVSYGDLIMCNIQKTASSKDKYKQSQQPCIVMFPKMDGTGTVTVFNLMDNKYYDSSAKEGAFKMLVWTDDMVKVAHHIIWKNVMMHHTDSEDLLRQIPADQAMLPDYFNQLPDTILKQRLMKVLKAFEKAAEKPPESYQKTINLLQKTMLPEISAAIDEQVKRIQVAYGKRMELAKARVTGTTTENAGISATTPTSTSATTIAKTGTTAETHPELDSITDGSIDGNARMTTTSDKSTPATTVVRWDTTVDNASEQSTSATNVAEDTAGAKLDSYNTSIPRNGNAHVTTTSDKSTPATTVVRWDTTVDNASEESTSVTNVMEDTAGAKMDSHHTSIPFGRSIHAAAEAQTFTTEPSVIPNTEEDEAMTVEPEPLKPRGILKQPTSTHNSQPIMKRVSHRGVERAPLDYHSLNSRGFDKARVLLATRDNYKEVNDNIVEAVDVWERFYALATIITAANPDQTEQKEKILASRLKELRTLIEKRTIHPVMHEDISIIEMQKRILTRLFTIVKRDGTVKSRAVSGAKGKPQSSEDVVNRWAPTVKFESVFMGLRVALREQRHISTIDFTAAFLNAKIPDQVTPEGIQFRRILEITPDMVELILQIKPEWATYVCTGRGKQGTANKGSIFFVIDRALYGLIEASFAWHTELNSTLIEMGFEQSESDPCVYHSYQNGDRTSIVVYVDDLLIMAKSAARTDEIRNFLLTKYGKTDGKDGITWHDFNEKNELDYLNVQIQRRQDEQGKTIAYELHQTDYANNIIKDLGLKDTQSPFEPTVLPYTHELFKVSSDSRPLDKDEAKFYATAIGKLLYTSSKVRPILALPVSFLSKRMKCPTEEDMMKLKRVLFWLRKHPGGGLTITDDMHEPLEIYVWADASDNCHHDAKGHTGIFISIGNQEGSPVYYMSKVQTLVSRSSTEAELIAVYKAIPRALWAMEAMTEWGYPQESVNVYQDNIATILASHDGNKPFSALSHMNRRFFNCRQYIQAGTIKMPHCDTRSMLADPLTKPMMPADTTKHMRKIGGQENIENKLKVKNIDEEMVFFAITSHLLALDIK